MLEVFAFSFLAMLIAVLGMSVGVLFGRPPIKGSCGGLNGNGPCELCSGKRCQRRGS